MEKRSSSPDRRNRQTILRQNSPGGDYEWPCSDALRPYLCLDLPLNALRTGFIDFLWVGFTGTAVAFFTVAEAVDFAFFSCPFDLPPCEFLTGTMYMDVLLTFAS